MDYLLDTDVLSDSSNPRPDPRVLQWMDAHDHELFLSTISLGEIIKGIELLSPGKRRNEIERWFTRMEAWAGKGRDSRLLPPDAAVMREWGRLSAAMKTKAADYP